MTLKRLLPTVVVCAALTACGSSTVSSTASQTPALGNPSVAVTSAAPVAAAPMPTSSPSGELSCANFDQEAAHLITYAHYASLNVGTNNDTAPTFNDMNESLGVLTAMAPKCAPKAVEAIAALGSAAGAVAAVYQPGDDPAVKAADKAALEALKAEGLTAWTAMGKDTGPWETALNFVE
ncbi:MAG: hypothetical protein WCP95_07750 [Actinomycetes bacterium]